MEREYLDLLEYVLQNGVEREDRTGVGTLSVFGTQIRCDLSKGFPLLTTKKVPFKPVLGELLWFVEGSSDERRLAEITYGTRDPSRTTIWTANANAEYWKDAKFEGDLGRVYGVQWRQWERVKILKSSDEYIIHEDGSSTLYNTKVLVEKTDQIKKIINTLKTNPHDRRIILSAFNVGEISDMALPPCHMFAQFYANTKTNKLSCQVYMRSVDTAIGLPFNIASYAILTHMIAQVSGFEVGELVFSLGDTHIYDNHIEGVKTQLKREPLPLPSLELDKSIQDIDNFKMESFKLIGYKSHPTIKMPMAV